MAVSGSFTGVGVSSQLRLDKYSRFVNIAISGTYDLTIQVEVAVNRAASAWKVLETYSTADATVAFRYQAKPRDIIRLNCTVEGETPGEATYTITEEDATERVETNRNGEVVYSQTEAEHSFTKPVNLEDVTVTGVATIVGVTVLSGDGAPTDYSEGVAAGTGAGVAGVGSIYVDTTNAELYINEGGSDEPAWVAMAKAP